MTPVSETAVLVMQPNLGDLIFILFYFILFIFTGVRDGSAGDATQPRGSYFNQHPRAL
jgi:hypothetical protein